MSIEHNDHSEGIISLSRFPGGLHGIVADITADVELQGRLMGLGLLVGTRFQLLRSGTDQNVPFLLAVGETRIAFGNEIAEMILVEP